SEIISVLEVYKNCEDFLSLGPVPYASMEMVLEDINHSQKEGGIFCGIYKEGHMVGIIDFISCNYNGQPDKAFISLLMIGEKHRRKGLGREVVRAIEEEISRNKDVKTILSGVQVNNKKAIKFWTDLNYKITGEPQLQADKTTTFDLIKEL
ncbi:MAG: GNAT family N-acetyltransferase, partial [Candidatus Eremiobacterota bacterium]